MCVLLPVVRCCFLLPHFTSGWTMNTLCCPSPMPAGICCWNSSSTSLSSKKSSSSPSSWNPSLLPRSSVLFSLNSESRNALVCRLVGPLCRGQVLPACAWWRVRSSLQVARAPIWQLLVQDRWRTGIHELILLRAVRKLIKPGSSHNVDHCRSHARCWRRSSTGSPVEITLPVWFRKHNLSQ